MLDGESDGCRADLVISDEGDRSYANAKTFSGSSGAAGHHLLQQLPRGLPGAAGTVELDGRRSRWSTPRPGAITPGACGAGTASSRAAASAARTAHGDDALQFRFASMVGSNGSFFRIGSLSRGGEKLPVADAEMLVHVDDDSVSLPFGRGPLPRSRTADHGRPDRHHRRHDRRDGATLRLGVGGRRDGRRRAGRLGLPRDDPQRRATATAPPGFVLGEAMTNGIRAARDAAVRQPAEDRALYYRQLRGDHRHTSSRRSSPAPRRRTRRGWSTGFWPSSSSRRSGRRR